MIDAIQTGPALLRGTKAIGEYLGVTEPTVRFLIGNGSLPAFKLAGRVCARPASLDRWLARRERAALQPCERETADA